MLGNEGKARRRQKVSKHSELRLSGDDPISERQRDLLDRARFADRIAELIGKQPTMAGLVVGIFGPCGSGKTSVLNLLRTNLLEKESVLVRDFNPWRVTKDSAILLDIRRQRPFVDAARTH